MPSKKTAKPRDGPTKTRAEPAIPWDKIKAEYLSTDTSLRKLCEKYHVPLAKIAARSKSEKWTELREQVMHKTETKMVDKIATKKADALDMVRDTAIETLYALNVAAKNIGMLLQHPPEQGGADQPHAGILFSLDAAKPLQSIASSLKTTQDVLYVAYSKLTPAQAEAHKVNAERLRIQKQMAEIKTPTAGEKFQIIITPPAGTEVQVDEHGQPMPVTIEDLSG